MEKTIYAESNFLELVKRIRDKKKFSFCSIYFPEQKAGGLAVSLDGEVGYYLPIFHPDKYHLDTYLVMSHFHELFQEKNIRVVFFDAIKELLFIRDNGIEFHGKILDTRVLAYMLCQDGYGFGYNDFNQLVSKSGCSNIGLSSLEEEMNYDPTAENIEKYIALKVRLIYRLDPYLRNMDGFSEELRKLYLSDSNLIRTLVEMRYYGIVIDTGVPHPANLEVDTTRRIHPMFDPCSSSTGRVYSSNPNVQNVAKEWHNIFISPDRNYVLIFMDYSQIELRILTLYAEDEKLEQAFKRGQDIHVMTAAAIMGKGIAAVSNADRKVGKLVNFSILYGISAKKLEETVKEQAGLDIDGQRYIDSFFEHYSGVKKLRDDVEETIQEDWRIQNCFGRIRRFSKDDTSAFRRGFNFIIQSTAADIFKKAIIRVDKFLKGADAKSRIIFPIHDELVFYWHRDEFHLIPEVASIMERNTLVPLKVTVEISETNAAERKGFYCYG